MNIYSFTFTVYTYGLTIKSLYYMAVVALFKCRICIGMSSRASSSVAVINSVLLLYLFRYIRTFRLS